MRYTEEAWSRSELAKTELEMEISKVRMEAAGLRDALLKMQNVNESLTQEKADLNKTLMQVVILFLRLLRLYLNSAVVWAQTPLVGFVVDLLYTSRTRNRQQVEQVAESGLHTTHMQRVCIVPCPSVCPSVRHTSELYHNS